ncbi:GNAT family N-acetyltransferase [Variovorax sp. 54]|uniref:GNAT family N-acetyltransferase n=1 Tax=Variovorax sp. 54 TaxID=2035212 RepID=UPI000C18CD75|nr:GNAT family N-acetyltransferase [Variovorax sp. 54]
MLPRIHPARSQRRTKGKTGDPRTMHRPAAASDFDTVFDLYMHEKVVPYLGYDPMPRDDFRAIFQELLDSRGFFIFEVDGQVAGFYRVTRYPGRAQHVASLGTLAVDPTLHGRGIARTMVTDVLARLKAEGVRRVELMAESDNATALRFYARLGFVQEGTLRQFYRRANDADFIDEHLMALLFD